ncbi:MAG: DUF4287 domain-containing protein [Sinomicrobium sp.]|nr:DUF4287 domain-containing protein [Sinomicrobium sp.]
MAKTSQEIEKEFMNGLEPGTGKTLSEWLTAIEGSRIGKRNDIVRWLKEKHHFGHMNASLLAGIYFNDGKPVYADEQHLLDNQFEKYSAMRPLFEELKKAILSRDAAVVFVARKTYISITKKREFAAVNIKKEALRLGMDLGEMSFDDTVESAKLTGPMPRISHMVVIRNSSDINNRLFQLLETADKRVNP